MRSEAMLTQMNIGSQDMKAVGGGVPELTRTDIAAVLGMGNLHDKYYYFALLRYVTFVEFMNGRPSGASKKLLGTVENYAYDDAVKLHCKKRWDKAPRGGEYLRTLTRAAVYEVAIAPKCLCGRCKGQGVIREQARQVLCPVCNGGCFKSLSGREKADAVGASETTWRRIWGWGKNKYPEIVAELHTWIAEIERHVNRYSDE